MVRQVVMAGLALALVLIPLSLPYPSSADSAAIDARIEIVWPHEGAEVRDAERANIVLYLFERGTMNAFCQASSVWLSMALNNQSPSRLQRLGTPRRITEGNASFVAWDFNDVDVSLARTPGNRLFFLAREYIEPMGGTGADGRPAQLEVYSNVWAYASNALTVFPVPDVPTGTAPAVPGQQLEPRIQIVWPQGGLPVSQADRANISASLFHSGSLVSVLPDYDGPVRLLQALNQDPLRPVAEGQKRLVTANGITYPVWDFNNVDVSAARDPSNKYFFQVEVRSPAERSNIWVHGADGRTFFPRIDVPERGCQR